MNPTSRPQDAPGQHGPGHRDCPTCEGDGTQSSERTRRPSVIRVEARGKVFQVAQLVGNLFVCSRANGNCCCGWAEKGRMPFDNALWSDEWERRRLRNKVHLTFTGCLGPCVVGNNALLQVFGRSVWFKDLNESELAAHVFDYIELAIAAGTLPPVPDNLRGHVYERYLTPTDAPLEMTYVVDEVLAEADDTHLLAGLDPVCLMDVDSATARYTVEHEGETYAFCGPGCRREFLEDPGAFLDLARS